MREMSSERENKSILNLGLDEILGQGGTAATPLQSSSDQLPIEKNSATDPVTQSLQPKKGEYESLAENGRWGEVIARSEKLGDLEGRLWWARAQCELAAMPLSIIAAPLEQSLREIASNESNASLEELASTVATKISQALIDKGEFNLATALLESGRKISPRLDAKFRGAAARELGHLNALPTRELDKHLLARKNYLLTFVSQEQGAIPNAGPTGLASANTASKRPPTSLLRPITMVVLAATLLTVIVLYYFGAFDHNSVPLEGGAIAAINIHPDVDPPVLKSPVAQRSSATSLLEAVLIEDQQRSSGERRVYEQNGNVPKVPSELSDNSLVINDRASTSPQINAPAVSAQLPTAAAQKERINTTSPLEPREIRDAESIGRRRGDRSDRADELFEKPRDRNDNGSTLSGDAQRYRVLVRTEVHAIPSFNSSVLQRLERGDPVAVEEREGQWFRIRGRNGKVGYIAAQDVEPQ